MNHYEIRNGLLSNNEITYDEKNPSPFSYYILKSNANKIDNRTKKIIQDFLDKLDDKNVYVEESVKYTDFKAYKQSMIKILLYNNQDKITKDIASLLM